MSSNGPPPKKKKWENVMKECSPTKTRASGFSGVYVCGSVYRTVFLRTTHSFRHGDDAYTKVFSDELMTNADLVEKLHCFKLCSRRQSTTTNETVSQGSGYISKHYVGMLPEGLESNATNRKEWADKIIAHLNKIPWQYPQTFKFVSDETWESDGTINGKLDRYLLNADIAGFLGKYVFENVVEVINHSSTLQEVFENEENIQRSKQFLVTYWNSW